MPEKKVEEEAWLWVEERIDVSEEFEAVDYCGLWYQKSPNVYSYTLKEDSAPPRSRHRGPTRNRKINSATETNVTFH